MRKFCLALVLLVLPLFTRGEVFVDPVMSKVLNTWDASFAIWYPPQASRDVYFQGNDPTRDYATDLKKAMADDPANARLICAYGVKRPPMLATPGPRPRQLMAIFKDACQKHKPTAKDLQEIDRWLAPHLKPWTVRRTARMLFTASPSESERLDWAAGVYFPPPYSPAEWRAGTFAAKFKPQLDATLRRAPLLAGSVCEFRADAKASPDPIVARYQADVRSICNSLNDEFFSKAVHEERKRKSSIWLNGILNTHLDAAASMSVDARITEARQVQERVKSMPQSADRLAATLRGLAMVPDDIKTLALVIRHGKEAANNSETGADANSVVEFLDELFPRLARTGSNALDWKRGWRNFLVLRGDVAKAREVAGEIVSQSGEHERTRDQVHLAVLDRLAGDPGNFTKLMESCPAPDRTFTVLKGIPKTPTEFCETVAAEMTGAIVELLGSSVPAASQIFAETNRQPVADGPAVSVARVRTPAEDDVTSETRKFSGIANTAIERAEKLPPAQREAEGEQARRAFFESGGIKLDSALKLLALRPYDEVAVNAVLVNYPDIVRDIKLPEWKAGRALLLEVLQRKSKAGPDRELWMRGLRNFYFFEREYATAAEVQKSLLLTGNLDAQQLDGFMSALLDLTEGKQEKWVAFREHCPVLPRHSEDVDSVPAYCRAGFYEIVSAAIHHRQKDPPPAFRLVLQEYSEWDDHSIYNRLIAIALLERFDPRDAEARYRRILAMERKNLTQSDLVRVFTGLRRMAVAQKDWKEARDWIDMHLEFHRFEDPGFPQGAWNALTSTPWPEPRNMGSFFDETLQLLSQKFDAAIEEGNFPAARSILETTLAHSFTAGEVWNVRFMLVQLARKLIERGKPTEASRIIGYLIKQPQDTTLGGLVYELTEQLKKRSPATSIAAQQSPWDSTPRKPAGRPKKPPLASGRTGSK